METGRGLSSRWSGGRVPSSAEEEPVHGEGLEEWGAGESRPPAYSVARAMWGSGMVGAWELEGCLPSYASSLGSHCSAAQSRHGAGWVGAQERAVLAGEVVRGMGPPPQPSRGPEVGIAWAWFHPCCHSGHHCL